MRRLGRILLIFFLLPPTLAAVVGWVVGPSFLHPVRRELSADLIREADAAFSQIGATRENLEVRAADGAQLRGWKVRPPKANGDWVLAFHGVGDNRIGLSTNPTFCSKRGIAQ
jgi:hypothetical protein